MKEFRVAILSHGGADLLLKQLRELEGVKLVGVFVESDTQPRKSLGEKIKRSIFYDGYLKTANKILSKIFRRAEESETNVGANREKHRSLEGSCAELGVPYYAVDNYHSPETIELLKGSDIDLGILYGTNIIREPVFSIPGRGTINLHQGLAPYYRGGPPLFWELLNGENEVGITIHYVAAKVDTGDVIVQETVPLGYDFSKYGLDYESFLSDRSEALAELSAKLMSEAVRLISEGRDKPLKQDMSLGKRYRLPSKRVKKVLVATLKRRRDQEEINGRRADVK